MKVFSIVIPTYDRAQILAQTLDHIERQEFCLPFEVIIVNDCPRSTLPDLYLGQGKRKSWELISNIENKGRATSRNIGGKKATGEFILFLDDDIWGEPGLLMAHYEKQKEVDGGVVVGAVPISEKVQHDIWNDHYRRWVDGLHKRMSGIKDDLTYHYFFTGNVSLPRSIFLETGGFDENFKGYSCEDTEMGYRLKKLGVKMVHQPVAVGWHYNIETLDSILNKKKRWGNSARYFAQKHPELAREISVAGLLAPGNKIYQVLLTPVFLWFGKALCRLLATAGFTYLCIKVLSKVENVFYAYGMKKAKINE